MAAIYKHDYNQLSIYGNVVSLLREHAKSDGVHLDIGCGYGPIAEPVRDELGLTYIGFDRADDGLESLRGRGFETHRVDLGDTNRCEAVFEQAIGNRTVSSLSFIDTLEHITNAEQVLASLRRVAARADALLALSVPNVAHKDLALKLLLGRWDVTEDGLLDHTHVTFYTHARLAQLMKAVGWRQVATRDWPLQYSDQYFPASAPVFNEGSPIGDFLLRFVNRANPHAIVNQFVGVYRPDKPQPRRLLVPREEPNRPFLSVVMTVSKERGAALRRLLQQLEDQSSHDFELILVHSSKDPENDIQTGLLNGLSILRGRTRLVDATGLSRAEALNAAAERCSARYFAIVDDADELARDWVRTLADLSEKAPGSVLQVNRPSPHNGARNGSAVAAGLPAFYSLASGRHGCFATLAIPTSAYQLLGFRFGALQPDGRGWDFAVEAILCCGLHASSADCMTPLNDAASQTDSDAVDDPSLLQKLNEHPILLAAGATKQLELLADWGERLQASYDDLEARLAELRKAHEELLARRATLEADNARLRDAAAAAQQHDSDELDASLEALTEKHTQLQDRSATLEADNRALREALEKREATESRLRAWNDKVRTSYDELENHLKKVGEEHAVLRNWSRKIEAENQALHDSLQKREAEEIELRNWNARIRASYAEIEQQLTRYSEEHNRLRKIEAAYATLESLAARRTDELAISESALRAKTKALAESEEALAESERKTVGFEHAQARNTELERQLKALIAIEVDYVALRRDFATLNARNEVLERDYRDSQSRRLSLERLLAGRPVLKELVEAYCPDWDKVVAELAADAPFLSVITRTQGNRPYTLRDTLLSLAGQTSEDFEVVLVVHSGDATVQQSVQDIVDEFPESYRARINVVVCTRLGRSSPINDGIAQAKGRYVILLDDDDIALAHWVETFQKLAAESPQGSILRATCTRQDYVLMNSGDVPPVPRAASWYRTEWPASFDTVAHIYENHTPPMCVAYPITVFREDGLWFDEGLNTLEDWDFMMRATMLRGMATTPEVTAIYRWGAAGDVSTVIHQQHEWIANRLAVHHKLAERPVLLPTGAAWRIASAVGDSTQLRIVYGSRSWWLTKPLRASRARLPAPAITMLRAARRQLRWQARVLRAIKRRLARR